MKRGTEPFLRPSKRQEASNLEDVLAQVKRSGCIYFVKSLPKTAIQACKNKKTAMLSLPQKFVHENADKIEQWVILRAHSSTRRWAVRLFINDEGKVRICGGLYAFVVGNRLTEGDWLIFVLQEDARSEFEVYMFRGSRQFPLCPDRRDRASRDEENNDNHSNFPSPLHLQHECKKDFTSDVGDGRATPAPFANRFRNHRVHKKAFTSDVGEGRATPSPFSNRFEKHRVHKKAFETEEGRATALPSANRFEKHRVHKKAITSDAGEGRGGWLQNAYHLQNHREIPSFRKQLTASNIGRSDRYCGSNSGQFEFPRRFIQTHGRQVRASVKLQGIYEDSPTHVITSKRRSGYSLRVDLLVTGWNRFVKENDLEKGHALEFSLMADSYFVVRRVY